MPPADLGVNANVLGFDGRGEGVGRWSVVIDISSENHILIFALDFVRSPGLPVITEGYFVGLDVLRAADTLCTLGNQARDPHSPLQVNLDPRPSVVLGSRPGVDQPLLVEACKVRVPLLQAEESAVSGGGCYLLVGDYTALHAQRSRAPVLTVPPHVLPWAVAGVVSHQVCANAPILTRVPFAFINIVLAVNPTEAWWTFAHVTYEGVAPVGLADLAYSSVVAGVWMARTC